MSMYMKMRRYIVSGKVGPNVSGTVKIPISDLVEEIFALQPSKYKGLHGICRNAVDIPICKSRFY